MDILGTIIGAGINPGSNAIAGSCGLLLGGALGSYLHSIKAHCDEKKLILKLETLPEIEAKYINANFETILETTLEQLNNLDKDCELKLNLGSIIKESIDNFCYLRKQESTHYFQIPKLRQGIRNFTSSERTYSTIERLIDEYYFVYLNINRKDVNSINRAMAKATVQIMRNTAIILIEILKMLAKLPGKENEKRLQLCKDIIKDYFSNILGNKGLIENYNKNLLDYFASFTTQREILATKVQEHFINLIDELIIEQREISVEENSKLAVNYLFEIINHFIEILARIFDKEASIECTEISAYKIANNMLRADTNNIIGKLGFDSFGFFKLLKPFAEIVDNLNQFNSDTDLLSYVHNHPLFNNEKIITNLSVWSDKKCFFSIDKESKKEITKELFAVFKLALISIALEKQFLQDIMHHGHRGLMQRGEYYSKRAVIEFFYQQTTMKIQDFFSKNTYIQEVFKVLNDQKWLTENAFPVIGNSTSFIQKTDEPNPLHLFQRRNYVSNSVFSRCREEFESFRTRLHYLFSSLKNIPFVKEELTGEKIRTKEQSLYLLNIVQIIHEFQLGEKLTLDENNKLIADEELFTALEVTNNQFIQIKKIMGELNNRFSLSATINNYQLNYGQQSQEIDSDTYQLLKQQTFPNFYWQEQSTIVLNFLKEQHRLSVSLPKQYTYFSFLEFYKNLQQLQSNLRQKIIGKKTGVIIDFANMLNDLTANFHELIKNINYEEEKTKKILHYNDELRSKNIKNRVQINTLSSQLSSTHDHLQELRNSLTLLSSNNQINLQKISEMEIKNQEFYQLVLTELKENVCEIKDFQFFLESKLEEIREKIPRGNLKEFINIDNELHQLKKEMDGKIRSFLTRISRYEKRFLEANEDIRQDFEKIRQSFSENQLLITHLEAQLNSALDTIKKQQEKIDFIDKPTNRPRVIVHNLKTLFAYLENSFQPRLKFNFFYRPIKTENLLSFIELLLGNQHYIKQSLQPFNLADFEKTIDQLIKSSKIINAHHFIDNSCSKHVVKRLLTLFASDQLIPVLKKEGINYHDEQIRLTEDGLLSYKQIRFNCPIQP